MLEKIVNYCLHKKQMIIFASLVILLAGVYSYLNLPIDAFPDVTNVQVEIVSTAKGLSAQEIERSVTFPIETSMRGLPNIEQLRSVTKYGLSIVTIVFKDNVDIYFARQLVFERLGEARETIPENVEVCMSPLATVMGEIYQYTLEGKMPQDPEQAKKYLSNLRTLQDWTVTPLLKNVPGVSEINSFGGHFKQYQIIVKPEMLYKHNLTIGDVFEAIDKNNSNVGGNIIEKYSEQFIVRGVGMINNIEDIGNIVLKSSSGTPVYVKDVAEVGEGEAVRQGLSIKNGKAETVGGIVMMLRGENSKEVVQKVKDKVKEINKSGVLPDGITIKPYYDRSDIVNSSVNTVLRALLEGSILVLIILYLLLKNFRGAAIVLITLPLSLLVTFIAMKFLKLEANLMSLGGLAISIGMVIDACIIQVENVQKRLTEKNISEKKLTTVLKAVMEVRKPSIFGELIIATTFLPIISLQGIEGKMFAPLAFTVAVALISSLILSIFVVPVFCLMILKSEPEKENKLFEKIKHFYIKILDGSLKRKKIIIGISCGLLALSLAVIPFLGSEFIPIMDEGAFDMDVQLLPSISIDEAAKINKMVGEKLKRFPELKTVVARVGQTGLALDTRGVDKAGYVGIMRPKSEWPEKISREELFEKMRESIAEIPGISFSFSQPIQCRIDELVSGTKAQLIIKLFGSDIEILKNKAEELAKIMSKIEGVTDLNVEKTTGQPYLSIKIKRDKIARYGLNVSDIKNVIEIAIGGKEASKLYENDRSFDIVVRYPEQNRNSASSVSGILVRNSEGVSIPLSELADIVVEEGPMQISREDGMRRIGIEMNVSGRDIGSVVQEAKAKIHKQVQLPDGYFLSWGGQFENQERAMNRLIIIAPLVLGIIILLLYITFRSIRLSFLIIALLPFALIGGILSLFISGQYLSVPASVGFIVLFGVAVLNGVVLVTHISKLKEDGMSIEEAIRTGCIDRLRPVLMTASIAIFSLIPMLFASGPGSEIQKPLATVVVGGLLTSTLLTLIILPSIYSWFDKETVEE